MYSILFYIGPVPVRAYGLMLWVGLMLGLYRTVWAARRTSINPEHAVDVILISVLAGVFGAHIVSILLDLPFYWQNPGEIVGLWKGILSPSGGLRGLSFHGGLIGGVGAAYIYTRRKKINFTEMLDLCTPGLAIGYGITRIGCFLNGCCYGVPTDLPWGVRFDADALSHQLTPPSHPTQLYAFGASIVIYMILVAVEKRRKFAGQVFLSYIAAYSVYRFLNEFLRRGVTAEVWFGGMTEAQIVSIIMLVVSIPILYIRLRKSDVQAGKIPAAQIKKTRK
ncbi:MAG: prolipoprotein diacylglyceryl transferase [Armatimonadota bacterium]